MTDQRKPTPSAERRKARAREELNKLPAAVRAKVLALADDQRRDARRTRVSRPKGLVSIDESRDAASDAVAVREERAHVPAGYELEELTEEEHDLVDARGTVVRKATPDDLENPPKGLKIRTRRGQRIATILTKPERDRWVTDFPTEDERAALAELLVRVQELRDAEAWEPREKHAIQAAYVAVFGHARGERWKDELRRTLEWQIELRREDTIRRARGLPRRGPAPGGEKRWKDPILSPSEILALVRKNAPDTPRELTGTEIDSALDVCSLGRGGGRGKRGAMTIPRWIEAFDLRRKAKGEIASKSARPARKKTRRKTRR